MSSRQQVMWVKMETVLDRRIWVYYLILVEAAFKQWGEQLKVRPSERFFAVLNEHVDKYINSNVLPPPEIAGAVMNIADDIMAGRDIQVKAGDYITVQNFIHGKR
jgi:hypothetical protein